jgi:hypothetical protein
MANTKEFRHYISSLYLKGFLVNHKSGKLVVFEKPSMSKKWKPINQICGEPNFFDLDGVEEFLRDNHLESYTDKNGIKLTRLLVENELSKHETEVGRILPSIRQDTNFDRLNREDLIFILQWIAWLYIANPSTKIIFMQKQSMASNTSFCNYLISLHQKIIPFFQAKTWGLGISQDLLLTSDRPVILLENSSNLLSYERLSKSVVLFPISPKLMLIGTPNLARTLLIMKPKHLTQDQSFFCNYQTYKNAKEIVISSSTNHIIDSLLERSNELEKLITVLYKLFLMNATSCTPMDLHKN